MQPLSAALTVTLASFALGGCQPRSPMGADGGQPSSALKEQKANETFRLVTPRGAWRIAELQEQRDLLVNQTVTVLGRVMSFEGSVMGRNWIELCDDSSNKKYLMVLSKSVANVGATLLVTGQVEIDQSFGAKGRYDVVIVDAELKTP